MEEVLEHVSLFSQEALVVRRRSVRLHPSFLCQWEVLQVQHNVFLIVPWLAVVQHLVPEVLPVLRCRALVSLVVLLLIDVRGQL